MSACHYNTLGLGNNASPREIRLAYLHAALEAHPDHGGSHSKMVAVNKAWEALGVQDDVDNRCCESDATEEWCDEYASDADSRSESGSEFNAQDDIANIERTYDYGDLNETGGRYKVQFADGTEVSLEEHEKSCGCGCGAEFSEGDFTSESGSELSAEFSEDDFTSECGSELSATGMSELEISDEDLS